MAGTDVALTREDKHALLTEWGMSNAQAKALKAHIAPKATDVEFVNFVQYCKAKGADPFAREMYLVVYEGRESRTVTYVTGIDRFRKLASTPEAPIVENLESAFGEITDEPAAGQKTRFPHPVWATHRIIKLIAGQQATFEATVWWDEYYPGDGGRGSLWRKMPRTLLGKCAEAKALRKATPSLGGLYVEEEMHQAHASREAAPVPDLKADIVEGILEESAARAAERAPDSPPPAQTDKADHLQARRNKRAKELRERGLLKSFRVVFADGDLTALTHEQVNDVKGWIAEFDAQNIGTQKKWQDPAWWEGTEASESPEAEHTEAPDQDGPPAAEDDETGILPPDDDGAF